MPLNERAAKDVAQYAEYAGPKLGLVGKVYCLYPIADQDGRTVIALQKKALDRAVSLAFSVQDLPCVTLWKNTNAEAAGYVTGIEPGTSFPLQSSDRTRARTRA